MGTLHSSGERQPSGARQPSSDAVAPVTVLPVTVGTVLRGAAARLANHSESPRLDAEILLAHTLGVSRSSLMIRTNDTVDDTHLNDYGRLLDERAHGTPIAYLTGQREFWSLAFAVTPAVLVPRPETELLVEAAVSLLPADQTRCVLDLGTGSGAIALSIASERPLARITGIDVSSSALCVARANARSLNLDRVDWRCGSWFEPVGAQRFDMIVSNPPYVASHDPALARLAAEPTLALTPGPTGLEALASIIAQATRHLNAGGWLLLEHGNTQGNAVAGLLERHGFAGIRTCNDYSNLPRVTLGTAPLSSST